VRGPAPMGPTDEEDDEEDAVCAAALSAARAPGHATAGRGNTRHGRVRPETCPHSAAESVAHIQGTPREVQPSTPWDGPRRPLGVARAPAPKALPRGSPVPPLRFQR